MTAEHDAAIEVRRDPRRGMFRGMALSQYRINCKCGNRGHWRDYRSDAEQDAGSCIAEAIKGGAK